jgi:Zinc knuckle
MKAFKAETAETVMAPTPPIATVLSARHETAGQKKTGKADSGTAPHTLRTPADEGDDWKKKIICRTCGVKGHIEKECPEKKAFQEFLASRKVLSAHANTVYTSFGDGQPDDGDDYVPYPYYNYKG